ncbi:aspartate aminotransferase family protein [Rhodospirillaceae bacterium SYSU D60014]|uniref:aspartate aminotransferase family protein n=1 Tax=Virgifigura deserti TaxID=2268457 RepID=UPI000E66CD11
MTQLSNSASARDIAYHLHPYTNAVKLEAEGPLVLTEGKGVYVYDENGKPYIEGMAGLWCTSLGFGEERLVEAATRQLRKLPYYHTFTFKSHDTAIDLAEKLIGLAPVPMSKVFFTNSGSEANDTVVKLVWYYNNAIGRPEKKKIIARLKGYHGVTVAAASLTGLPYNHIDFDLPIANILHTDCPHHYRFGLPGESEEDFASRMAANLEKLILDEGPDTVAAFIAEPVQGAGGVIIPPRTYFEKIQAVLKKYDILFIADEVITGFGRTGSMFGIETYGLKPDIISVAKQLSSAYLPIAAVMINEKVYQAIRDNSGKLGTFGHGFTYSGHPASVAVALETLKIYEERDIVAQVRRLAPVFQEGLQRFADHPLVGEVRGVGLVGAIELVKDKATKESFDPKQAVGSYAVGRAQEHGVILRAIVDSVAFCPPLIATEAEITDMFDRFGRALDDTATWVQDQGLRSVA